MSDEIAPGGRDELGVLLLGHPFTAWWTGTILTIDEARALVPHQNATTMQVAGSIIGALAWMLKNPQKGVLIPDQLPHEEILSVAAPYLGTMPSVPLDWTPTGTPATGDETWQFANFLISQRAQKEAKILASVQR